MSETRSVETTAPDIESAIELGLRQLGVTRESVIVEILEEPSRGLLGLGAKQARVRLTTAAPLRQVPEPITVAQPVALVEDADEIYDDHDDDYDDYDDDKPGDDSAETDDDFEQPDAVSEAEMDDDARIGLATLEELLGKMHIKANVSVYRAMAEDDEEAPWVLQIRGPDLGVLIGRRGETLASLQYITRLIASRDLQRRANIVLDVEGYKARREQMLYKLARRMADQALQMGRAVALEPMSPYERRIVHLALRDHPDVTTESVGEGDSRKVTIVPNRR